MNPLVIRLIKGNAVVAVLFLLLLIAVRVAPFGYRPSWILVLLAYICGLLWANGFLFKQGRPVLGVVLILLLFPMLGFPIGIGSLLIGRRLVERQYQVQGLQMVEGCNAAAANEAEFDIEAINERLSDLTNSAVVDTNLLAKLQHAYVIARDRERILDDDCGKRGHCDDHPWNTNWAMVKKVLAETDER